MQQKFIKREVIQEIVLGRIHNILMFPFAKPFNYFLVFRLLKE